jgi:hypothetical protein
MKPITPGITAVIKAVVIAIAGPVKQKSVYVSGSFFFRNNFNPSASGCNNPPFPARFGPIRS